MERLESLLEAGSGTRPEWHAASTDASVTSQGVMPMNLLVRVMAGLLVLWSPSIAQASHPVPTALMDGVERGLCNSIVMLIKALPGAPNKEGTAAQLRALLSEPAWPNPEKWSSTAWHRLRYDGSTPRGWIGERWNGQRSPIQFQSAVIFYEESDKPDVPGKPAFAFVWNVNVEIMVPRIYLKSMRANYYSFGDEEWSFLDSSTTLAPRPLQPNQDLRFPMFPLDTEIGKVFKDFAIRNGAKESDLGSLVPLWRLTTATQEGQWSVTIIFRRAFRVSSPPGQ
jgi:hypothetical protein